MHSTIDAITEAMEEKIKKVTGFSVDVTVISDRAFSIFGSIAEVRAVADYLALGFTLDEVNEFPEDDVAAAFFLFPSEEPAAAPAEG